VVGRKDDLAVVPALGWKVGESVPSRTRGACFAGEAGLGVALSLAVALLLAELVSFEEEACVVTAGLRADAGVALLLTFALGRRVLGIGET
jgi:hypothetical protein